ncbi:MAG: helix-turn-helix domain-containing protein [Armatimonadota bacterium]|nr:helix-turn-helix domain-containing protein [Armatimonadota bacterium]MDR7532453.1 helix-turn-helix domain-containing protein [Armatimonadota bacterium]MDR7535676.1 helix-turn-helix domain-containing protein [Armatimonadota bacterium]
MTVDQVARYLQLNRLTVYRYIREGRLPASRIGKVYRIRVDDVERFLEARKVAGARTEAPRPEAAGVTRRARIPEEEIAVAPARPERRRGGEAARLDDDPLEVILRGLH